MKRRAFLIVVAVMMLAGYALAADLKPNYADLSYSYRTAQDPAADKADGEARIQLRNKEYYNGYLLIERENFIDNIANGEWFLGYGGVFQLQKYSKLKIETELFDRHRYNSNSHSVRAYIQKNIRGMTWKYGAAFVGKNFKNYQPAGFLGMNYKKLSINLEYDINNKLNSSGIFNDEIMIGKSVGIALAIEGRYTDRSFFWIKGGIFYKEAE